MKLNFATLKSVVSDIESKTRDNRISNITLINSRVFLISFSTYRKEKLLVCLEHQNPFISFCEIDESISTISGGLSDVLRKELKEAIILEINLLNNDRVVDIHLVKTNDYFEKEEKHLILELIPFRTNLLLLDKENKIYYAAHYSSLDSARPIVRGIPYEPIKKNDSFIENEEVVSLDIIRKQASEYVYQARTKRILERYEPLFKHIKVRIKSLKQKLKVLDKEYENAKEQLIYQEYGNTLLAFINSPDELKQYIEENNLEVDFNEPIGQTANKYFKRYKKAKRTLEINRQEYNKAIKEIEYLEVCQSQLDYMNDEDMYELAKEIMPYKFRTNGKKEIKASKYSYVLVDNTKIYFGKNMQQNNDISFKIAKKEQYYFHIKDYHGSHVLIANDNPTKEMILTAAEMCLILSNKTSGDVQYTKIKNIKKGPELGLALLNTYELITLHSVRESTYELLKKHN